MKKYSKHFLALLTKKQWSLFLSIFAIEVFFRFYQIGERNPFAWDQVDNAWAAKNLLVNHWYPLVGMVAKQNSGFYIGPLYYYIIAIVYWITNLNPIASGIFAGITSAISFFIIFFVTKKLFSFEAASIASFIYAVSVNQILFDRTQWPVDLIPAISLLIFYYLYKVITGNPKYLFLLAASIGVMFNLHFTAVFFPIIIFLCLPFFPWKKISFLQIAGSMGIFLAFLVPNIIYEIQQKSTQSRHMSSYLSDYYHGLHGKRILQLTGDAFIQFVPYLTFPFLSIARFFLLLLFLVVYLYKNYVKRGLLFCYLCILWFVVPWIVFATYSGEITDYYFAINRCIALIIIAYLLYRIYIKGIILKVGIVIVLLIYGFFNIQMFFQHHDTSLYERENAVKAAIQKGEKIQYTQGVPESYLYYYYMRQKGVVVYDRKKY